MPFRKLLVILLFYVFTIPLANAGEHGKAKQNTTEKTTDTKEKPKVEEKPPTHIYLPPFMAPVRGGKKGRWSSNARTVTVFLKYGDEENVARICQLLPRIKDSIMTTLSYNPIPLTPTNKLNPSGIDAILLKSINQAMGKKLISRVYILDGQKNRRKKDAASLAFTSANCSDLESAINKKSKKKAE